MGNIKLAGAAWSFVGTTLLESANIWRALGIQSIDLFAVPGAQLDSEEIEQDPKGQARRFKKLGMPVSNLFYLFGTDFENRALNSPDVIVQSKNMDTLKKVLDCCRTSNIPSLLILPGIDHPGMSHEDAIRRSGEVLTEMTAVALESGVLLIFEPHVESVLENPKETLKFLKCYSDLKIALDYSHFIALGYKPSDVHPLLPYTRHFHLRQGAYRKLQSRWEDSEIDFTDVVRRLQEVGYEGYLTLEYEHEPGWMKMDQCDVMTESIKMRNLVNSLLK